MDDRPTLTMMVGFPRSGKSTWIEENKGDLLVVGGDMFRDLLFGSMYSDESNMVILSFVEASIRLSLSQG